MLTMGKRSARTQAVRKYYKNEIFPLDSSLGLNYPRLKQKFLDTSIKMVKVAATGNALKAAVAAVCWASNRIDIFRTGDRASDLQHNWWDGSKVCLALPYKSILCLFTVLQTC